MWEATSIPFHNLVPQSCLFYYLGVLYVTLRCLMGCSLCDVVLVCKIVVPG
jgi:hypothetical protein